LLVWTQSCCIPAADGYSWRNLLDFDPLQLYNGFSYNDVLVIPVAEAIREVWEPKSDKVSVGALAWP
jgi:hypothetical protein